MLFGVSLLTSCKNGTLKNRHPMELSQTGGALGQFERVYVDKHPFSRPPDSNTWVHISHAQYYLKSTWVGPFAFNFG